jgi:hypothetical protein
LYSVLEYDPSTSFCEVPVLPPIVMNSLFACLAVPSVTTSASIFLKIDEVDSDITRLTGFGFNSSIKSP